MRANSRKEIPVSPPIQTTCLIALLSILYIASSPSISWAAEGIVIPAGATDSYVCGMIECEYSRGMELWRAKNLSGALERFKASEDALKKRSLWMPPKLPEKPAPNQLRAFMLTNEVIYSLATIYQQMGRRMESERYAEEARNRGLLGCNEILSV